MIEYPKMLYKSHDDYTIVDDKEAEKKARKSGFVDYAELDNGNNELLDAANSDSDVATS